jgi:hypothetical protein
VTEKDNLGAKLDILIRLMAISITPESLTLAERASRLKPVYYGIIDGHDSNRLRLAYPSKFKVRKTTG